MGGQELAIQLICPCTGKCYKNTTSLKIHHKSKIHIAWENQKSKKDELIKANKLEIEIEQLKRINVILLDRIAELTNQINSNSLSNNL